MSGNGAAWLQAIALACAAAAIVVAIGVQVHRPFDPETLAIEVGELRSQAVEAAQLVANAQARRLAPVFTHVHARQLSQKVQATGSSLQTAPSRDGVRETQAAAAAAAAELTRILDALAAGQGDAGAAADALHSLGTRVDALARRLPPQG